MMLEGEPATNTRCLQMPSLSPSSSLWMDGQGLKLRSLHRLRASGQYPGRSSGSFPHGALGLALGPRNLSVFGEEKEAERASVESSRISRF